MGDTGTGFYRIWLIKLDVFVLEHQNVSEEDFRACKAYLGRLTKQEALLDSEPGVSASISTQSQVELYSSHKNLRWILRSFGCVQVSQFLFSGRHVMGHSQESNEC